MQIKSNIYCKILNMPEVPPETGGIIGTQKGIITNFIFDKGTIDCSKAIYTPNIALINNQIQKWKIQKISFCGIVHTHPDKQIFLSKDDIYYIEHIMAVMPKTILYLYFPIILPHKTMISYIAKNNDDKIEIYEDKIIII